MNEEKLYNIIIEPLITEKSMNVTQYNQYAFKVRNDANKNELKKAVQVLFNVEVENVRVANVKPQKKRFGRQIGKTKGWKKAFVKLKPGYEIDITGAQA